MLRNLFIRVVGLMPVGMKNWFYRHPAFLVPLARLLRSIVPTDAAVVVTIKDGPNKGMKLALDRATPSYYWLGRDYETAVEDEMQRCIKPGAVVADIGAHLGHDTMIMSRLVGPTGSVLSFEPDPASMRRLQRNCELNDLRNVRFLAQAVSDHRGTLRFSAVAKVTSHVLTDGEQAESVIEVPCTDLDSVIFADGRPTLHLAKIDVEDSEAAVLAGARRVLSELRPVLLIEIHSDASLAQCTQFLSEAHYDIRPISLRPSRGHANEATLSGQSLPNPRFTPRHILCRPANTA